MTDTTADEVVIIAARVTLHLKHRPRSDLLNSERNHVREAGRVELLDHAVESHLVGALKELREVIVTSREVTAHVVFGDFIIGIVLPPGEFWGFALEFHVFALWVNPPMMRKLVRRSVPQ